MLSMLAALVYNMARMTSWFLSRPVSVHIAVVEADEVTFPAVTVCGLSPVKMTAWTSYTETRTAASFDARRRRKRRTRRATSGNSRFKQRSGGVCSDMNLVSQVETMDGGRSKWIIQEWRRYRSEVNTCQERLSRLYETPVNWRRVSLAVEWSSHFINWDEGRLYCVCCQNVVPGGLSMEATVTTPRTTSTGWPTTGQPVNDASTWTREQTWVASAIRTNCSSSLAYRKVTFICIDRDVMRCYDGRHASIVLLFEVNGLYLS